MPWRARTSAITLALCAAAADSAVAATSRPFTGRAGLTTGFGIAGVVLIGLASLRFERQQEVAPADPASTPSSRAQLAWGTLAAAVVGFELVNFFTRPRSTHPTISSLLDLLAGHEVLRGLLFAAWLCTGWWLWRRS